MIAIISAQRTRWAICLARPSPLHRVCKSRIDATSTHRQELATLERERSRIIDAIKDGLPAELVAEEAKRLTARIAFLTDELEQAPSSEPILHPAMSRIYAEAVQNLISTLNEPDHRSEAAEILRGLISKIVLPPVPSGDRLMVDLEGDLAGILAIADGTQPQSGLTPADNKTLEIDMTLASAIYRLPEPEGQGVVGNAGCGSRI